MHRASRGEKGNRAEGPWIEMGHSMAVVGAGIAPRGRRLSPGPSDLYACQTGHLSMAPPFLPSSSSPVPTHFLILLLILQRPGRWHTGLAYPLLDKDLRLTARQILEPDWTLRSQGKEAGRSL